MGGYVSIFVFYIISYADMKKMIRVGVLLVSSLFLLVDLHWLE